MTARVLLLRGINVGGRNSLPMAALREILAELGAEEVETYIQSGNAVFRGDTSAGAIGDAIETKAGFRPHPLLLTAAEFRGIAKANPYGAAAARDGKAVHVFFCDGSPEAPGQNVLDLASESEDVTLAEGAAFLLAPDGVGRSRLAARLGKALGVPATARNWKTVEKLLEMLDGIE